MTTMGKCVCILSVRLVAGLLGSLCGSLGGGRKHTHFLFQNASTEIPCIRVNQPRIERHEPCFGACGFNPIDYWLLCVSFVRHNFLRVTAQLQSFWSVETANIHGRPVFSVLTWRTGYSASKHSIFTNCGSHSRLSRMCLTSNQ